MPALGWLYLTAATASIGITVGTVGTEVPFYHIFLLFSRNASSVLARRRARRAETRASELDRPNVRAARPGVDPLHTHKINATFPSGCGPYLTRLIHGASDCPIANHGELYRLLVGGLGPAPPVGHPWVDPPGAWSRGSTRKAHGILSSAVGMAVGHAGRPDTATARRSVPAAWRGICS